MSVQLYAAETWTLLSCDEKTLKAFQRQILHIQWTQHITKAEVSARTGIPPAMELIRRCHLSAFGHKAWLTHRAPAHDALHCQVGLASSRSLGQDWRCEPGRPDARWTDQLCHDTGSVPANLWRQAVLRGHPWSSYRMRWPRWLSNDDDESSKISKTKKLTTTINTWHGRS